MLAEYILILYWLLVAIGAALVLGTGAALHTFRRTGAFPRQPATDSNGRPVTVSPRTALGKCAVGTLLIAVGLFNIIVRAAG